MPTLRASMQTAEASKESDFSHMPKVGSRKNDFTFPAALSLSQRRREKLSHYSFTQCHQLHEQCFQ